MNRVVRSTFLVILQIVALSIHIHGTKYIYRITPCEKDKIAFFPELMQADQEDVDIVGWNGTFRIRLFLKNAVPVCFDIWSDKKLEEFSHDYPKNNPVYYFFEDGDFKNFKIDKTQVVAGDHGDSTMYVCSLKKEMRKGIPIDFKGSFNVTKEDFKILSARIFDVQDSDCLKGSVIALEKYFEDMVKKINNSPYIFYDFYKKILEGFFNKFLFRKTYGKISLCGHNYYSGLFSESLIKNRGYCTFEKGIMKSGNYNSGGIDVKLVSDVSKYTIVLDQYVDLGAVMKANIGTFFKSAKYYFDEDLVLADGLSKASNSTDPFRDFKNDLMSYLRDNDVFVLNDENIKKRIYDFIMDYLKVYGGQVTNQKSRPYINEITRRKYTITDGICVNKLCSDDQDVITLKVKGIPYFFFNKNDPVCKFFEEFKKLNWLKFDFKNDFFESLKSGDLKMPKYRPETLHDYVKICRKRYKEGADYAKLPKYMFYHEALSNSCGYIMSAFNNLQGAVGLYDLLFKVRGYLDDIISGFNENFIKFLCEYICYDKYCAFDEKVRKFRTESGFPIKETGGNYLLFCFDLGELISNGTGRYELYGSCSAQEDALKKVRFMIEEKIKKMCATCNGLYRSNIEEFLIKYFSREFGNIKFSKDYIVKVYRTIVEILEKVENDDVENGHIEGIEKIKKLFYEDGMIDRDGVRVGVNVTENLLLLKERLQKIREAFESTSLIKQHLIPKKPKKNNIGKKNNIEKNKNNNIEKKNIENTKKVNNKEDDELEIKFDFDDVFIENENREQIKTNNIGKKNNIEKNKNNNIEKKNIENKNIENNKKGDNKEEKKIEIKIDDFLNENENRGPIKTNNIEKKNNIEKNKNNNIEKKNNIEKNKNNNIEKNKNIEKKNIENNKKVDNKEDDELEIKTSDYFLNNKKGGNNKAWNIIKKKNESGIIGCEVSGTRSHKNINVKNNDRKTEEIKLDGNLNINGKKRKDIKVSVNRGLLPSKDQPNTSESIIKKDIEVSISKDGRKILKNKKTTKGTKTIKKSDITKTKVNSPGGKGCCAGKCSCCRSI